MKSTTMITYFQETCIPDSPETKSSATLSPKAPMMTSGRPLSSSSNVSGLNGHHSPLSALNGRTPSPSGPIMNSSIGQQLPPACGARQLSKLKRFLTTLQQFGSDISPEIGERVRSLVLGLVNSHLSIEEFHSKLQEATNFPLRPFVIPFLKANLPLLQRELFHCARTAKLSPQQYLSQNEHVVFDPDLSPLDPRDSFSSDVTNVNGKRMASPDRHKENGSDFEAKRHHGNNYSLSPLSGSRASPGNAFSLSGGGPIRLEDISKSREMRERLEREHTMEREREKIDRDRERNYSSFSYRSTESLEHLDRLDDDWRHVETMLNCIMGMVDKTKRAIAVLHDRSIRDREELSLWSRRPGDSLDFSSDIKKTMSSSTTDSMAFSLRQTEEQVTEVRRRAEAVNNVKRQAMLELQKAMSAADQKAVDLLNNERAKMERTLIDERKKAQEIVLRSLGQQEESAESCWNCGRKASETCSGCNVARYCGSFCQHKDWENHHYVCGKAHITTVAEAREQRRATLTAATTLKVGVLSTSQTAYTTSLSTSLESSTTSSSLSTSSSTVILNTSCSSSSFLSPENNKDCKSPLHITVSQSSLISPKTANIKSSTPPPMISGPQALVGLFSKDEMTVSANSNIVISNNSSAPSPSHSSCSSILNTSEMNTVPPVVDSKIHTVLATKNGSL